MSQQPKNKWIYIGLINVFAIGFWLYAVVIAPKDSLAQYITGSIALVLTGTYVFKRLQYQNRQNKEVQQRINEK